MECRVIVYQNLIKNDFKTQCIFFKCVFEYQLFSCPEEIDSYFFYQLHKDILNTDKTIHKCVLK